MSDKMTHNPHGSGIRGLSTAPSRLAEVVSHIDHAQGQFGRLFDPKVVPPADFNPDDLWQLAQHMKGDGDVKDESDPEESHIPAAYTYFGQFVDHDLTFDPSTFKQQKSDPTAISDFRTPKFDLDNVYGRGPSDQPFMFDGNLLVQGSKMFPVARNPFARDLPRANNTGARRAIIGDPRNDENVIVSQLQGMMFRFHNRIATSAEFCTASFDEVSSFVRNHYQWIVVHDFLTRIVRKDVLDEVSKAICDPDISFAQAPPQFKLYTSADAFMPVEFSVAAYRLGHSMVRPGYRVNENINPLPIFNPLAPSAGLNAFGEFPNNWAIDWQRFVDLGMGPAHPPKDGSDRVQMAYKLDTSLVEPLSTLPDSVAGDEAKGNTRLFSLAYRNLLRGQLLKLPSGQAVATAMGVPILPDDQIIIGAATDKTDQLAEGAIPITKIPGFAGKCPLWVYVLAEARKNFYNNNEARLGPVGGRIVAETFLKLMALDPGSIVSNTAWKPKLGKGGRFTLSDLLLHALGWH